MPYCCAFGCKERQGRGKRFHKFPREPKRRKVWELKVKRANWKANDYSILCEDHFEEAAYETGRVDGLRRLRSTAVPTQFVFTPRKLPGRTTKRSRRTEGEPCVGGQEHIQIDHSYCSTSCAPSFEVQTVCDSWNLDLVPESSVLCCPNSPLCQQNIQGFSNASGIFPNLLTCS
ncbi:peroxynitrite isomerase THAP4-like isoform X2 [Sander lucioperca]|uniref:peroxynitrite isomerase THAP4-like isoform X2 n=1 Tax=Sander lucioperca TaxID=283035 RepID=UPI00125E39D2|nr:peroxynitrite isomerase THAP4-like isoform X2 [Sander lucioperca]